LARREVVVDHAALPVEQDDRIGQAVQDAGFEGVAPARAGG
jgi:hypothetical protein